MTVPSAPHTLLRLKHSHLVLSSQLPRVVHRTCVHYLSMHLKHRTSYEESTNRNFTALMGITYPPTSDNYDTTTRPDHQSQTNGAECQRRFSTAQLAYVQHHHSRCRRSGRDGLRGQQEQNFSRETHRLSSMGGAPLHPCSLSFPHSLSTETSTTSAPSRTPPRRRP